MLPKSALDINRNRTKSGSDSDSILNAQFHTVCEVREKAGEHLEQIVKAVCKDEMLGVMDKAVLSLMFRHGLRISEVLSIRPWDVKSDLTVYIKGLKGSDNRLCVTIDFRDYWKTYRTSGTLISQERDRFFYYRNLKRMGIGLMFSSNVNCSVTHLGRHLYALSKSDVAVSDDMKRLILGHKRAETIEHYLRDVKQEESK